MKLTLLVALLCQVPVAQDKDEGIPWGQAEEIQTDHFLVTCNLANREIISAYIGCLEESHDRIRGLFAPLGEPEKRKVRVFITSRVEDYHALTGSPVTWFLTRTNTPSMPKNTLVTYHGAFGERGTTREALRKGVLAHFQCSVVDEPDDAGAWMVGGLMVLVAESPGMDFTGVRRERLQTLQEHIRDGKEYSLEGLLGCTRENIHAPDLWYCWSLVHWMLHADDEEHRPLFYRIWEEAKEGPVSPERIEAMIREETGQEIDEFQEKTWRPYVLGLPLPKTGNVQGEVFTSERFRFACALPSKAWKYDLKDLALHVQCVMRHGKIPGARVEVTAKVCRGDAMTKPEDGFRWAVDTVQDQVGGEPEIIEMVGYKAARFVREGEIRVVIPTRGVDYTIRCEAPVETFDELRKDFDAVMESFERKPR